ncbi:MAG: OmpA family protein [Gallionellaceae bacterium]|nr:OmpA family protein [Gallionellaceae bacterium]
MPVPEAAPAPVAAVVAPTPPAESVKPGPAALKRYVPFAFGRVRLGPQGREAMATVLAEAKSAERIHVRGYTDIFGKMPENKTLAMSRAAEVRTYLIKGGVDLAKITTSYCIDCFIESNESEEGRAANRQALVALSSAKSAPGAVDMDHRDACRANGKHVAAVKEVKP